MDRRPQRRPGGSGASQRLLRQVVDQIAGGEFAPGDRQRCQPIAESLMAGHDPFFKLADFADCCEAQEKVNEVWKHRENRRQWELASLMIVSPAHAEPVT